VSPSRLRLLDQVEELEADVAAIWPKEGLDDFERYSQAARKFGNRHTHLSAGDTITRVAVEQGIPLGRRSGASYG